MMEQCMMAVGVGGYGVVGGIIRKWIMDSISAGGAMIRRTDMLYV